jgi:hypothetical protein
MPEMITADFISKRELSPGNACKHSMQILLSSRLPSKKNNIKMCTIVIASVGLYGCETWSLMTGRK